MILDLNIFLTKCFAMSLDLEKNLKLKFLYYGSGTFTKKIVLKSIFFKSNLFAMPFDLKFFKQN